MQICFLSNEPPCTFLHRPPLVKHKITHFSRPLSETYFLLYIFATSPGLFQGMYKRRSNNGGWRTTTFSGSRQGGRSSFHRGYGGAEDDLVEAMGRVFVTNPTMKIPPLSSFSFGPRDRRVAVAGDAVVIGERVPQAEDIPTNYPSPSAYLKVKYKGNLLSTHWWL